MIVYFSSTSRNTERFVARLGLPAQRVTEPVGQPFILITPTYADAYGDHAVPKPVKAFLGQYRHLMRGVIGTGNRSFGATFALGGRMVAAKCGVPLLHRMELAGTDVDVEIVQDIYRRMLG